MIESTRKTVKGFLLGGVMSLLMWALIFLLIMGTASAGSVSDSGLTAHYNFDTNISDITGHYGEGTNYGAELRDGALFCNASENDYINLGEAWGNFSDKDFSVVFRFKVPKDGQHRAVLSKGISYDGGFLIYKNTADYMTIYSNDGEINVGTKTTWNSNEWTDAVFVREGSAVRVYINGVKVAEDLTADAHINNTDPWVICAANGGTERYYNGSIDELYVFNRSLSESEIKAFYHNLTVYVNGSSPNCDDGYLRITASNQSTPWCSLQGFLTGWGKNTKLKSGDTVMIAGGTYNDGGNKHYMYIGGGFFKNVTIMAVPGEEAIITNFVEGYNATGNGKWTYIGNGTPSYNIWTTTYSGLSTDYPIIEYANGSKFVTNRCLNDTGCSYKHNFMKYRTQTFDQVWADDSTNEIRIRLKDDSADPNNIPLYISEEYDNVKIAGNRGEGWVIIKDLTFKHQRRAITIKNSSNVLIDSCTIEGGHWGIVVEDDGHTAENIIISNNYLDGHWNYGENWIHDFIKNAYEETTGFGFDGYPKGNVKVLNNTFINWAGGVTPQADAVEGTCNVEIGGNTFIQGEGSQIELENTGCNYSVHHNKVLNSTMGLSLGGFQCTENSPSTIEYNTIKLKEYIRQNESTNYSTYASKYYRATTWNVSHVSITHNTFISRTDPINGVYLTGREHDLQNATFRDNILYAYGESQRCIYDSGMAIDGVFYDYNLYYCNGSFAKRWNNDTDTTEFATLADALSSSNWDGTWDINSIQAYPWLNDELKPYSDSPACGAASDGKDIGAEACISEEYPKEGTPAPAITSFNYTQNNNQSLMSWNTNINSNTTVCWNESCFYNSTLTTYHAHLITGLNNGTWYNFTVSSAVWAENGGNSSSYSGSFKTTTSDDKQPLKGKPKNNLPLIIGIGIAAFLILYFVFQWDAEEHALLRLFGSFFFVFMLLLLAKATMDSSDTCEQQIQSIVQEGNVTYYNYEYVCVENTMTTSTTFYKYMWRFVIGFMLYLFIYFNYKFWIKGILEDLFGKKTV